ncbi:emp24/gp25L/p24 family/GOLD-domain-containing protein [Lipomyces tetrasporus]|uniref:Emp24/gp25L/p24 family/GOLD-domain-containing protein n=1 Tax=Lipomyces tetrasporus TaxID=54092 RepID=A0AAD7VQL2_9ASCO|nr:emp24/gp25L/p24 family/GOLD-domain-containing protein [Lipomyces tetrasporus]KAJ8099052.1 emp24/gp25L/p24 family/GOLD-domain-containing protein [Lipomyces tetrasporus]
MRATVISSLAMLVILMITSRVEGLYFYLEGSERKCFLEELPQDTLVVGFYNAEEFVPETNVFVQPATLGVQITVEEIFDNNHRVVNQRGAANGKFTFTAADSGEHRICFQTNVGGSGWFSRQAVRVNLDIAVGETGMLSKDHTKSEQFATLVEKVQELNHRLADIKREQMFQREREAEFRDESERTNARVVRWSIIQLIVIGATCAWQLSHLRGFFVKQKLV